MKVELTAAARADLDDIFAYTQTHFPFQLAALQSRFEAVFERIGESPEGARNIEQRVGIRVVPLIRYPFKVFYRIIGDRVEIVRIYHTSRAEPPS
jgi:plasmid stabilization system protein ParE